MTRRALTDSTGSQVSAPRYIVNTTTLAEDSTLAISMLVQCSVLSVN